jgi:hypothetical protein
LLRALPSHHRYPRTLAAPTLRRSVIRLERARFFGFLSILVIQDFRFLFARKPRLIPSIARTTILNSVSTCTDIRQQLQQNGSIENIRRAVHLGRPKCTDIVPGSPLRHFLYKSRGNVQFAMPSWAPYFEGMAERRRYVLFVFFLYCCSIVPPIPWTRVRSALTVSMFFA